MPHHFTKSTVSATMDSILLRFTPQEKADAICTVLQNRLNAEE